MTIQLPQEFEKYRSIIEPTLQPVLLINTIERPTSLFESKFEGNPYFPLAMEYPKNANGQPLKLLAQINFADVPKHLPHFPTEGILQFYIDGYDDVFGMDFKDGQNQVGFRVIFHEEVMQDESQLIQDFSFVKLENEELYFPVTKEMALTFAPNVEPLSVNDFRSYDVYEAIWQEIDAAEQYGLDDKFYTSFGCMGHRIGGYPFFTQTDPRAYNDLSNSTVLLLQIDSVSDHIMWGDTGVGNFFITEDELKRKDFSKVLYNWDCC
ncbi:YwqG family protein [Bacillus ndiopicus]|uniref:YwqG family protein n=1 Tax=Bacillus ndiopicus TaxID=1347368 RepID=UPI0005AB4769|nr:YwqG family protein [Bacillus ndiopicus]